MDRVQKERTSKAKQKENLFEVWVRVKPYKKLSTSNVSTWGEKQHFETMKNKFRTRSPTISKSEFNKREKDYQALYTANGEILFR
jgi:hypothetical protein